MTKRPRKPQVDRGWKPRFVQALAASGNIRASCLAAGVSRRAAYAAKVTDPAFAEAWSDALDDALDGLQAFLWSMARTNAGVAMWLLRAHRREVYGDRIGVAAEQTVRILVSYEDEPAELSSPAPARLRQVSG